jgi:hypothetical protein
VVPNDPVLRTLNARQIVANIKGAYHDPTISVPPPIEDGLTGVDEFSSFSDGGLSSPNVPKWGIAGCSMYHPERRLATNPLQDYEKVVCDTNDPNSSPYTMQCTLHPEGKGVILHHFIPGQYCSSTRAEIYPVLLALCCRMTVRLATDSANMLRQLLVLINNPLYKPSKPWNLLPDGDLWQIIQKLIISIGHSNARRIIEAGKVKAHTDKIPDAIEKGIITLYQQTCNKVADDYAPPSRIGSVMQNESQYAIFCHKRADVYADLLKIILSMFVRVLESDRKVRAADTVLLVPTGLRKAVAAVKAPRLPRDTSEEDPVTVLPMCPHPAMLENEVDNCTQVFHFLRCIKLRPVVYPQQGASWLELFCYFDLLGGQHYRDPEDYINGLHSTFKKDFTNFRRSIEILKDYIAAPNCDLFKPCCQTGPRLQCLGIIDSVSCFCATIVYDDTQTKSHMLQCLLSCNKKLDANQLKHLFDEEQPLVVKSAKICMGSKAPPWRELRLGRQTIQDSIASFVHEYTSPGSGHDIIPASFLICCPHCDQPKEVIAISLYDRGTYKQIQCRNPRCLKSAVSKKWNCVCKLHWFKCHVHAQQGFAISSQIKRTLTGRRDQNPTSTMQPRCNAPHVWPDDFNIELITYPCIVGNKAAEAKRIHHESRKNFTDRVENRVDLPKATGDRIDPRLTHCIPLMDGSGIDHIRTLTARRQQAIDHNALHQSTPSSSSSGWDNKPREVPVALGLPSNTGRSASTRPRLPTKKLRKIESDEAARASYDRKRACDTSKAPPDKKDTGQH